MAIFEYGARVATTHAQARKVLPFRPRPVRLSHTLAQAWWRSLSIQERYQWRELTGSDDPEVCWRAFSGGESI